MNTFSSKKNWAALAAALACAIMPATCAPAQSTAPKVAAPLVAKPVAIKPTPEQKVVIDAEASTPCDRPAVKIEANLQNRDGSPNPNFGKPNGRFLNKHQEFLARGKQGPIGLLFLGDSITEGWNSGGKDLLKDYVEKYHAANFGISGDRTQHVLWRIENGELDGISPKVLVLMIGTNNIRSDAGEILKGDLKIVESIHKKLPNTRVLVLGIFPRGADPANLREKAYREKIKTVNEGLAKLEDGDKTRYLDIGGRFLAADGKLPKEIMPDALHPNAQGYQIWSSAMKPLLEEMMK